MSIFLAHLLQKLKMRWMVIRAHDEVLTLITIVIIVTCAERAPMVSTHQRDRTFVSSQQTLLPVLLCQDSRYNPSSLVLLDLARLDILPYLAD